MSQSKYVKLLAALAVITLMAHSVVGQEPRPQQQPGAQPEFQAPREGQQPRAIEGQRGERPAGQQLERQGASAGLDNYLAIWLASDNEVQVALSQQVAQHAENEEVKQFAQQMVEDHQQMVQQLRSIAQVGAPGQPGQQPRPGSPGQEQPRPGVPGQEQPRAGVPGQDQPRAGVPGQDQPRAGVPGQEQPRAELPGQERPRGDLPVDEEPVPGVPGQDRPGPEVIRQEQPRAEQPLPGQPGQEQRDGLDQPGQRQAGQDRIARRDAGQLRGGQAMVALQLIAIKREVCQRNLQSALEELQNKEGAEFDKCYMQLQLIAHQDMANTIEVFQRYATGELQSVLQEAGTKVESHLQEAKELAKKIDSNGDEVRETDANRNEE